MKIETNDPYVFIIAREDSRVVYENVLGEVWEVTGVCNSCGQCEEGSENPYLVWTGIEIGREGACYDSRGGPEERGDYPILPDMELNWPKCTLRGRYLNAD